MIGFNGVARRIQITILEGVEEGQQKFQCNVAGFVFQNQYSPTAKREVTCERKMTPGECLMGMNEVMANLIVEQAGFAVDPAGHIMTPTNKIQED